jgi:orotate phosphoribosyltransferase
MSEARRELLNLIAQLAYREGEFRLASGQMSSYYIDGKMVTLHPRGAHLVGQVVFEQIKDSRPDAIGGLMIGADPIAAAVAVVSDLRGQPIPAFIARKEIKDHGTRKALEGPVPDRARVVIIDDVNTTGGSLIQAADAARESGCEVVSVIAIVDREQGGRDNIEAKGYRYDPIFTISDVRAAYRELQAAKA